MLLGEMKQLVCLMGDFMLCIVHRALTLNLKIPILIYYLLGGCN
jgi:hypothetical protein